MGRHLEREGLLVRDLDSGYLSLEPYDDDGLAQVLGNSITYRIALGPRQGHKAFAPQTLLEYDDRDRPKTEVSSPHGSWSRSMAASEGIADVILSSATLPRGGS